MKQQRLNTDDFEDNIFGILKYMENIPNSLFIVYCR